jgi:YidC/Oxa1 family membrane protein insertase
MDAGRVSKVPAPQPAKRGAPRRSNGRVSFLFDFFSLDVVYYPVSWIMWAWYKLFAFVLGPTNFFAWALSVMFLVFTLRALLYKPFVRQIRTTRQMQELQPQIKALQKKYGKDRQRMALEMQKLQREHGFNPILGCLPMLAQIPVFLGLYHVLRSFNRTTGGFGQPHMSVIENRMTGNYVFPPADVGHFLDANLWGAPIGAFMTQRAGLDAFTHFSRPAVIAVGAPVMILAGIATYFNSRASVARQSAEAAANPQTAMMNKLALYVFPLGVVVGGPFLPLAIILYWFSNNIWTFGQQHYVFRMIEKEDEAKRQEAIERRAANAPAPGAKPRRNPKTTSATGNGSSASGDGTDSRSTSPATDSEGSDGEGAGAKTEQAKPEKPIITGRNDGPSNRTPRPGARPKRRRR